MKKKIHQTEVQKFFGSWFFGWDEELRCPVTGQNAVCNTSDLNEELGQVRYFFFEIFLKSRQFFTS